MNNSVLKNSKVIIRLGSMIMGLLYVLPIIIANRYYNDDAPEVLFLSPVWIKDGRPLTDLLMRLLCGANNYIYDLFPLTLILAVIVLMIVSAKWTEKFYDTDGAIGVIVTFLPLSMGFYLSNLSYRFDCIGYTMSVVFIMIPFMVDTKVKWKKYAINTIFVLISMCFYQATIGMYLGLIIVVMFIRRLKGEKTPEDLLSRVVSVAVAAVLYKTTIAPALVDEIGWRGDAGRFADVLSIPETMLSNIYKISMLVWMYLRSLGGRQVILYVFVLLLAAVATYLLMEGRSTRSRVLAVLLYCSLVPGVYIVSILPMSILEYSSADSRHLPELISLMFVLSVSLVVICRRWPRTAMVLGIMIVLFRFSFSYAYGNILRQQRVYADYVAQSIARDIEELDSGEIEQIVIDGEMPYSPVARSLFRMMPILKEMVPSGLDGDGMLNGALINHYYPYLLDFVDTRKNNERYEPNPNTVVVKRLIYDMYAENNRVYVRFKQIRNAH